MRKLQITEGEAKIFNECFINEYGFYTQPISISSRNGILLSNAYGKNKKEAIANAQLIADAFNTANKCDMLPSELLDIIKQINDSNFEVSCELQDRIVQLFKK